MRTSALLLPLAAAGLVAASPIEERAATPSACGTSHPKIHSAIKNAKPSIITPYCQSIMHKTTKTVTKTASKVATVTVHKTVSAAKTVTNTKTTTNTVNVTSGTDAATSSAAAQTLTSDTVPKRPGSSVSASASASVSKREEDVAKRAAASATEPKVFSTLNAAQISTACSCVNPPNPTHTVTKTKTTTTTALVGDAGTKTVTSTHTAHVTNTVTATPTPFYIQASGNTTVNGMYGSVTGETMNFVSSESAATEFTINGGELISGSNGWIANIQNGSTHSTLFFDSASLIANKTSSITVDAATCVNTDGIVTCKDGEADTLYYCDLIGAQVVIASSTYDGPGCNKLTFNAKQI